MNLLDIKDPRFLDNLNIQELEELAKEIRDFLIMNISKTGGHLSSNLGIVELTIGIHKLFNSPKDKIVFDVGHQTYIHKILTGRAKDFSSLRKTNGLSGFPSREESMHDEFSAGHSSTSISAISGFLLSNSNNYNIAVIGDGALTGGEAFEGLNYLGGTTNSKAIIILNDNNMTISESVGALHTNLSASGKIFFENLGFEYIGPFDGNNINEVLKYLKMAKESTKPIVVHAITKKGLGYSFAENDKEGYYHGVKPFDVSTGKALENNDNPSWSKIISEILIKLENKYDIKVVVPAMVNGLELKGFRNIYPEKLIDVGIAEQHAITMGTAASITGSKIFVPIYSTFLQRAYDQILNDASRLSSNMVIGIDRAGLVGEDGETHQGIFDLAMLQTIPNIEIVEPSNPNEAYSLLDYAFNRSNVVAIRYPKDNYDFDLNDLKLEPLKTKWLIEQKGNKKIVISYGRNLNIIKDIVKNEDIMLINARFIKPLDELLLDELLKMNKKIICVEEVTENNSLAQMISFYAVKNKLNIDLDMVNLKDDFIKHGSLSDLRKMYKLDYDSLKELILCD